MVCLVLPLLLAAYSYFQANRAPIKYGEDLSMMDYLVRNSDILLGLGFLIVSAIPFFMVYEKRQPKPRDLIPIAVMAALCVVGRAAFAIIPLPHFKPVSALVIITALVFGPEAGFLTGALSGFISNFVFGQGPWTPWQMFCWGMIGFIAGTLYRLGCFRKRGGKEYFVSKRWDKLCPEGTSRGDLLIYVRKISDHAPMSLCLYGLFTGFFYGWIMNIYFLFGYVDPITWQAVGAIYLSSVLFDFSHGLCTFLVLWGVADPWCRKLERVKVKFGLAGEEKRYVMPLSTLAELEE